MTLRSISEKIADLEQRMAAEYGKGTDHPMGMINNKPYYNDPNHPAHKNLTPEEHHTVSNIHEREANRLQSRPESVNFAERQKIKHHRNMAGVHHQMAFSSPSSKAADRLEKRIALGEAPKVIGHSRHGNPIHDNFEHNGHLAPDEREDAAALHHMYHQVAEKKLESDPNNHALQDASFHHKKQYIQHAHNHAMSKPVPIPPEASKPNLKLIHSDPNEKTKTLPSVEKPKPELKLVKPLAPRPEHSQPHTLPTLVKKYPPLPRVSSNGGLKQIVAALERLAIGEGGTHIGTTKTGQHIYDSGNGTAHPTHDHFSPEDHDDASEAHSKLAGAHHNSQYHSHMADYHKTMSSLKKLQQAHAGLSMKHDPENFIFTGNAIDEYSQASRRRLSDAQKSLAHKG